MKKIETATIIKQKTKNKYEVLFLISSYFLLKYINRIKLMTITTKNKSGIKGPDIKDIGINKKRINEKFIILC